MPLMSTNSFDSLEKSLTPPLRQRPADDKSGRGYGKSSALLARLSQEVATLRAALEASRQQVARLEMEAAEDPVTGLLNERALKREIAKAISFRSRYHSDADLALIKVDGMAGVAERHGPRVCGRVLRTLGDRLRGAIRSCDVAARIEPYQFVVVMWNVSSRDDARRLDQIRAALGGLDRLLEGRVAAVRVRAIATRLLDKDDPDAALARAEGLLEDSRIRAVRR